MNNLILKTAAQPKLTNQRWFILTIFCLITFLSAYQWNNLIIIPAEVIYIFNSSLPASEFARYQIIDFLSTSYQFFYIILMVPSSIVIAYKGLRASGIIAISFIVSGCWIKTLATNLASSTDSYSFSLLLFGQLLCAFSNAFVLATPPYLSSVWFGDKEMALATSIGVLGNQLGIAFGFFVPPSIVINYDKDYQNLKFKMLILSLIASALSTITLVIVIFFYQNQPANPPNKAQMIKRFDIEIKDKSQENSPLHSDSMVDESHLPPRQILWKSLFKRIDFILLTLSYGIMVGVFYGISTLIDKILENCFKDFPRGSGIAGMIIVVSGIFGSVICGFILQKTRKFKSVNLAVYFFGLLGMLGFLLAVHFELKVLIFIMSGFLGFFMTGYLPLGYEFAAVITFPINEDISSGVLSISAQIFGIVLVIIPRIIIQTSSVLNANIFLLASMFIGIILKFCIKEKLRRPSSI